ncbi:MAG: hypothetical protein L6Q81_14480 [Bacteroidia bacterium]|nr:hypothetical protein [Bacteroidia bacterium]
MRKLIYHRPGSLKTANAQFVMIAAIVIALASILIFLASDGSRISFGGLPIAFLIWRFGNNMSNRKIHYYFKQDEHREIYFGYNDENKKRVTDFPVDEYSNFYVAGTKGVSGQYFKCYVQLKTEDTIWLITENIFMKFPPEGWSEGTPPSTSGNQIIETEDILKLHVTLDAAIGEEQIQE